MPSLVSKMMEGAADLGDKMFGRFSKRATYTPPAIDVGVMGHAESSIRMGIPAPRFPAEEMGWSGSKHAFGQGAQLPSGHMGWEQSAARMGPAESPPILGFLPGPGGGNPAAGTALTHPGFGMIVHPTHSNAAIQKQAQFTPTPTGGGLGMNILGGLAGGALGGVTSLATGGEFGTGFVAGVGGAFGAKQLKRAAMNNMAKGGGLTMTKKFASEGGAKGTAASALNMAATSMQTAKTRHVMMGGAGLSGIMFGGDRKSHQRGFNQSRGNRF